MLARVRPQRVKKVLLETWAPTCEIIPAKRLFFKSQKGTATSYYDIEKPLPDLISKLRRFWGLLKMALVGCQVPLVARARASATGSPYG